MIRRYVYDPDIDMVVEAGQVRRQAQPARRYLEDSKNYDAQKDTYASESAGERHIQATLERAERREWAHLRYGDERRWTE